MISHSIIGFPLARIRQDFACGTGRRVHAVRYTLHPLTFFWSISPDTREGVQGSRRPFDEPSRKASILLFQGSLLGCQKTQISHQPFVSIEVLDIMVSVTDPFALGE